MNVICPLSISESWAELTHHTVQGLILRLSETPKIAAVIPILESENAREYYCFGYRGEKIPKLILVSDLFLLLFSLLQK